MDKLYDDLLTVAKKMKIEPDNVEDLVQTTFHTVLEKGLPLEIKLLVTVLKRIYYNQKRREALPIYFPDLQTTTEVKIDPGFSDSTINALESLTDFERKIFLDKYLYDKSTQEIAEEHQRTKKTITNILSKTRKKLQKALLE